MTQTPHISLSAIEREAIERTVTALSVASIELVKSGALPPRLMALAAYSYLLHEVVTSAGGRQLAGKMARQLTTDFEALRDELGPALYASTLPAGQDAEAEADDDDALACLNHLLRQTVGPDGKTLQKAILDKLTGGYFPEPAGTGIKVEDGFVLLARSFSSLELIFQSTRWRTSWPDALLRLDGAHNRATHIAVGRSLFRCIAVPVKHFTVPAEQAAE